MLKVFCYTNIAHKMDYESAVNEGVYYHYVVAHKKLVICKRFIVIRYASYVNVTISFSYFNLVKTLKST